MKHLHLDETLAKLNAKNEGVFDFGTREENGQTMIFDRHENYHYDYEEDLRYTMAELNREFHQHIKLEDVKDEIMPELEKAVKADFGEDAYIDWENNVVMCVGL